MFLKLHGAHFVQIPPSSVSNFLKHLIWTARVWEVNRSAGIKITRLSREQQRTSQARCWIEGTDNGYRRAVNTCPRDVHPGQRGSDRDVIPTRNPHEAIPYRQLPASSCYTQYLYNHTRQNRDNTCDHAGHDTSTCSLQSAHWREKGRSRKIKLGFVR